MKRLDQERMMTSFFIAKNDIIIHSWLDITLLFLADLMNDI